MKPRPSIHPASLAILAAALLAAPPAPAQSAEGFDVSGLVPAEPAAAPAPKAPEAAATTADLGPSRYAGDEVPAYVRALSARFSIRKRECDPFGRFQDPDRKAPPPKTLVKSPHQQSFKPEAPTPFADVIAAISVKLVDASKQQFLIEDRVFKVKEVVKLALPNGKQVKAQIMAVTSSRIVFRNLDTGESAALNLDLLPANMRKGNRGITVPGVQPAGGDAPIQIQPAIPLSNNP